MFRPMVGFSGWLCAATLALLLSAGGCGQSEGERCQVDSDCASGLKCSESSTGNGICKSGSGSSVNDAAVGADAPIASGSADVPPEQPEQPQIDAQATVDAQPASGPDATGALDAATVDVMSVDTGAID